MLEAKNFKTKSVILPRMNVWNGDNWLYAIDVGYSGVKAFSPNCATVFPSYARKVEGSFISGFEQPDDIFYKNQDGEMWRVGESAQNTVRDNDSQESDRLLYGRNRYNTPMFKVIVETALGILSINNNFRRKGNGINYLQTGLPPKYIKTDSKTLNEAFVGEHKFSLKIGGGKWQDFDIYIDPENILDTFSQPMGSLYSALLKPNGKFVEDAKKILSGNSLVADGGFVTFDTSPITNQIVGTPETFTNYGMKEVLTRTVDDIYSEFGVDIPVYAIQKYLADGKCKMTDKSGATVSSKMVSFTEILNHHSENVCLEVIEQLENLYDNFSPFEYLTLTGGTCAAWFPIFKARLSQMDGLSVIGANRNEDLSHIFSNVRGYYLFAYRLLKAQGKL